MKKCIRCGENKGLSEFYAHPKMRDGHLNKCKSCCREQTDLREKKLRKNPDFCENERIRHREKHHRLGYGKKQYEIRKSKTHITSQYKNQSRDLKLDSNENGHHWNYNYIDDIIILNKKFHRFIHRYLKLNELTLIFESKDGQVLDTKEKHLNYIENLKKEYGKEK